LIVDKNPFISGGSMPVKKAKRNSPKKSRAKSKTSSGGWGKKIVKHKGLILVAVAVYAVLFAVINWYFFVKKEVRKEIPVQVLSQFTGVGKSSGPFYPADVAALGNDKIAVSDSKIRRILVFNRDGELKDTFAEAKGKEAKNTAVFSDLSADEKGNMYVIDDSMNSIRVYDIHGENIQNVSLLPMSCYVPRGVNWNGNYFLVADTGGQKIIKVSPSGEMLDKWGTAGDCKECFNNPYKVVFDPQGNGNFYVPDFDNRRVKYMNSSGKVLKMIKVSARPNSVAVDAQGNLYVASMEGNFVKVYGPNGGDYKGDLKDSKGVDSFSGVRGMDFAPDGTLILAEEANVTLVKLAPTGATAAK
jgi:sugar lactone lactonase YvrE